jgi:HTH-type transcriptional regulator/antitoxin HigA
MTTIKSKTKFKTEKEYSLAMNKILRLMNKGEGNLSVKERASLQSLALAAQAHEQSSYKVSVPKTLAGMIELRMYELRLKQTDLAKKLGVSPAKLSLILNGKQKPDLPFIKAVHAKLNVDADFILEHL